MKQILLLLFLSTFTFPSYASDWKIDKSGRPLTFSASTYAVARNKSGEQLEHLPSLNINILSEYVKFDFFISAKLTLAEKFCVNKEYMKVYPIVVAVNGEKFEAINMCNSTDGGPIGYITFKKDMMEEVADVFKKSLGLVKISVGNLSFYYDSKGFTKAYKHYQRILPIVKDKKIKRYLEDMSWEKNDSYYSVFSLESSGYEWHMFEANLSIRNDKVVILFVNSHDSALRNCPSGEDLFSIGTFTVDGTKVKVVAICKQFVDSEKRFLVAITETDKDNDFIINLFKKKSYVEINDLYFTSNGFADAWENMQAKAKSIEKKRERPLH